MTQSTASQAPMRTGTTRLICRCTLTHRNQNTIKRDSRVLHILPISRRRTLIAPYRLKSKQQKV